MANPTEYTIGRVVTYQLHKLTPEGPIGVFYGTIAIDTMYKTQERSARGLLAYMTQAAFEEAAKNPGFVDKHGSNPEDFFITVSYEFTV